MGGREEERKGTLCPSRLSALPCLAQPTACLPNDPSEDRGGGSALGGPGPAGWAALHLLPQGTSGKGWGVEGS